ncbi:MAG: type II toxin-antitoxin system prevent-host-death family antitoxin [Acetobacteraceae bacterium]|nr:type II toxin-antitoxin system prevent-host-death family antitoxin [Acetobacteraceae bacterium]
MIVVGAFEAKTRFASLLDQVAAGEQVTITKHGTPVARLVPVPSSGSDRARKAIARLKTFHKGRRSAQLSARTLPAKDGSERRRRRQLGYAGSAVPAVAGHPDRAAPTAGGTA